MLVFNIGILSRDFVEDFMEETVGQLHDVVFGEASHLFATVGSGVFECVTDDLFRARTTDELEALHHVDRLTVLDPCVQILFVFSDDHDIHLRCFVSMKGA